MSDEAKVINLTWHEDAIWVQDQSWYMVHQKERADSPNKHTAIYDPFGQPALIELSKLKETHELVENATVYKASYRPVQAYSPGQDATVITNDGNTYQISASNVLLRTQDGSTSVIQREDFNRMYQFISGAGLSPT